MGDKLWLGNHNILTENSLLASRQDWVIQYDAVTLDPLRVWSRGSHVELLIDLAAETSAWDTLAMLGTSMGQAHTWRIRGYQMSTIADWVNALTITESVHNVGTAVRNNTSMRIMLENWSGTIGIDPANHGSPTDYVERVSYTGPPRYPAVPTILVRGANPPYYYGYGISEDGGLAVQSHYPDITQYALFTRVADTGDMPVMGSLGGDRNLDESEMPPHRGAYWRCPDGFTADLLRINITGPPGSLTEIAYMWMGQTDEISVRTEMAWDTVDSSDVATGPDGAETLLVGSQHRTLEIPMERIRRDEFDLLRARLRAAGPDNPVLIHYESSPLGTQERSGLFYPTKRGARGKVAGYGRSAGALELRERNLK